MNESTTLGVFVGDTSFIFVETTSDHPTKLFDIVLTDNSGTQKNPDVFSLSIDQLSSIIQNTIRHQEIKAEFVNLSLPTKDIIFRSFVIPWIPSGELNTAI
ncbi:MAG: hypothetical protein KC713_04995, partial [Candidatus Omnitrophica bacterium]|nr:hypothetical protein [Candidatus Omnitrophota bacterium]